MFEAKIETISELFQYGNAKGAFTIPIYQRDYRWGDNEVQRFMDDIRDGLRSDNDFKRFIGAVIFVESKESDFDSSILSLIDGQQRIITITLLLISLYESLKEQNSHKKIEKNIKYNIKDNIVELLVGTSIKRVNNKEQIYPKIIRESVDIRKASKGYSYNSSIAKLLHSIGCEFYGIKYDKITISDKVIKKNLHKIKNFLDEILKEFSILDVQKYIFNNILFTTVIVKNEDYAFDIFESLNSTGEPLTAIETFIPLVVKESSNYKESRIKKYVDNVLSYIRDKENTQNISTNLVLWQSLLFDGENVSSKHLSVQRRHLRGKYNNIKNNEKILYIEVFSELVTFIKDKWENNSYDSSTFEKLALSFLEKTKTPLLIPILTRFHREDNFKIYLKVTTAFFVLWRAYTYGTDGIDKAFKSILRLVSYSSKDELISVDIYKSHLHELLKNKINNLYNRDIKKTWLSKSKKSTFGRSFKPIGKFILLAAHDNAECINIEGKNNSLIKENQSRTTITWLSYENFIENKHLMEIEHISPQRVSKGWNDSIYQDKDTIHLMGNLTLLSRSSNSMKSNMNPDHTHIFYKALSSGNKSDLENLVKNNKKIFTTKAKKYLNESYKYNFLESLEDIDFKKWNEDVILDRSENIMSLAWDTLYPWIKV